MKRILDRMRCPECMGSRLDSSATGLTCAQCSTRYQIDNGIVDFVGDDASEVITPFQRIMQTPLVVSIYERLWRRAGYFIASSRSFDREIRTILSMPPADSDGLMLDLACGTGVFTRPLAQKWKGIVVGLDLSRPMLRHARRLTRRDALGNIVLVRGSAFRLPFGDGTFRHINCCGALHLFDQPDLALEEIERVLDPEGSISVQTTIRPDHSGGFAYFLEHFIRFGFFDEQDLKRRVAAHGLAIIRSERHRISYSFQANKKPEA